MRLTCAAVLVGALVSAPAVAFGHPDDGLYGRLSRDLVLSAEVLAGGAIIDPNNEAALSVALRARTLDMTGVVIGYDRSLGVDSRRDSLFVGIDLRPAMLARWSNDLERGPRWIDLTLDSIGLELGASWLRPGADTASGFGMVVGGGVELPLVWSEGTGVMLRLAARYTAASPWNAQGTGQADSAVFVGAGLVFRTMVRAGVVRAR